MLIRVDRLRPPPGGIASSTRNRESAPGSPKTHVGPTPTQTPPSHGWCRPLRIQELAPKWEPRLFPFPTPGAGLAFRVKGGPSVTGTRPCLLALLAAAPRPTYNAGACHVLRPGRHSLPFPSRSGPISSRHSFSGSDILLSVCLLVCLSLYHAGPWVPGTLWYGRHRMTSWNGSLSASRQRPGRCYRMPRLLVCVSDRQQPLGLADLDAQ
jgi:hypothetical protein